MDKSLFTAGDIYNDKERYYGEKRLSSFSGFAVSGSVIINIAIVVYAVVSAILK